MPSVAQKFQSTLPRGERPFFLAIIQPSSVISIHAPARGATINQHIIAIYQQNFNPRSREGSDPDRRPACTCSCRISIHAPARGATLYHLVLQRGAIISIHAPARGATSKIKGFQPFQLVFQSTLPRGERLVQRANEPECYDFNPRSREGSDGCMR